VIVHLQNTDNLWEFVHIREHQLDVLRLANPLLLLVDQVTTETIGETVMAHLRDLDDVAYVRFASVYRNFREAKDFEAALAELSGDEAAE